MMGNLVALEGLQRVPPECKFETLSLLFRRELCTVLYSCQRLS